MKTIVQDDLLVGNLSLDADELRGRARDASDLLPGLLGFGRSVNADDRARDLIQRKSGHHAGLRSAGHRTHDDVVEDDAEFDLLQFDLLRPPGETKAAERMVRGARRNGVGRAAAILNLEDRLLPALLEPDAEARAHEANVRPHQSAEQNVADAVVGHVGPIDPTLLDEDALHARLRGRRGHLPCVVRLHAADRHERVASVGQRVGHQVFEFSDLVAAECEGGVHVVALGPDRCSLEVLGQTIQPMNRRRAEHERVTGKRFQRHGPSSHLAHF